MNNLSIIQEAWLASGTTKHVFSNEDCIVLECPRYLGLYVFACYELPRYELLDGYGRLLFYGSLQHVLDYACEILKGDCGA